MTGKRNGGKIIELTDYISDKLKGFPAKNTQILVYEKFNNQYYFNVHIIEV